MNDHLSYGLLTCFAFHYYLKTQVSFIVLAVGNLARKIGFVLEIVFGNCPVCNLIGKYLAPSSNIHLTVAFSRPYVAVSFSFPRAHCHYSTTVAALAGTYFSVLDHSSVGYKE